MSTEQYRVGIHDDVRIIVMRISRPEIGNNVTLEADWLPKGTDSRDDPTEKKTLTTVFQSIYSETDVFPEFPEDLQQALIVVNNYIESKILNQEFGTPIPARWK